ncbi:conserved exported hypothetical protein [Desulfamplus magnetovallimortis]|uniref:Solute-binding protein family 3/N-terminal domain-containing protein n=1 Tax=Desulfamplus magnetovallimortis TaxID=1246637 RepID=A0A1W1HFS3_9BACT|nr:transporter substrate-binding domain-containing protein [Desulfamplus magnetovallimortis]SLM31235.1 conserved exported hypothetical protein [Desulfamplus magnetovallimortis]
MKKRIIMISLYASMSFTILLSGLCVAKQQLTVYGDANYPPYSYEENGQPKGVYVDILTEAFSRMEAYDVTIEMRPWKRGIHMIKAGKVLALFPPYFNEERTLWMNYSEPILQEELIIFAKAEKLEGKSIWPDDFYGSKVGLNRGFDPISMAGEKFSQAIEAGKIELEEADNNEMNLKKLEAGRLDYYINDKLIDITAYPSITRGMTTNHNFGYLGFTRKYENFPYISDFKNEFDQIIKEMKAKGEIDKILQQYLK